MKKILSLLCVFLFGCIDMFTAEEWKKAESLCINNGGVYTAITKSNGYIYANCTDGTQIRARLK